MMSKRFISIITILSLLVALFFFYRFSLNIAPSSGGPSRILLNINVYDYFSNKPIRGLELQLNLTAKTGEEFSILISPGDSGVTVFNLTDSIPASSELFVSHISFHGMWVLEKIIGEREYLIANNKWSVYKPEKLLENRTEYLLENIPLKKTYNSSTVLFTLEIFIAKGRPLGIFNPIKEALRMDPRLKANVLFTNFVEVKGANLAIMPTEGPSVINMSLSYVDFSWKIDVSFIPDEKPFIDLTPILIRAVSHAQSHSLREIADILKDYGFNLEKIYSKMDQMVSYYEQAAQQFENQNYEEATKNLYMAQRFYRETYATIIDAYVNIIGWSPTLIIILVFFSFSLSRLISERKILANIIFIFLLLAIFLVFLLTHQGVRLFVLGFHHLLRIISIPSLFGFLFQLFQVLLIVVVVIISYFTYVKDLFLQTFDVSIRNLRRRKMKTLLALLSLTLISASAMCLLTINSINPVYCNPVQHLRPKVDYGLVIYKQLIITTKSSSLGDIYAQSQTIDYIPIEPYEISLLPTKYFKLTNIYGIKTVQLSRADGFTIDGFNVFNVVVVNPEFIGSYLNTSEIFREWLSCNDQSMVLIGSKIASKYDLTEGSSILLNKRRFTVKSIFSEEKVAENLKDIDGDIFLFKIYDKVNKKMLVESFILGSIKDFTIQEIEIYKISLILKSEYANNITIISNEILSLIFDYWENETSTFMLRYLINVVSGEKVFETCLGPSTLILSGNWQVHMIPLFLTSLLLFMNALGTIFERASEIRTMFTVGANPLRIRLILIVEGAVLGIIGGILGYIIGYLAVNFTGLALPTLIRENLISGSPFTISFSISVLSSLIGYLIPSGKAVLVAVPSRAIKKKVSDIIKIEEQQAVLEIPIRLQEENLDLFDMFLRRLIKEYDGSYYKEIVLTKLTFEKSMDRAVWNLFLSFSGGYTVNFQVSITARMNRELEVNIKPLNEKLEKISRWSSNHKSALKIVSQILREEILKFIVFRGKY